ncbi:MAG TPA: hypothetical protein VEG34_15575 [Thermoanaerobaculia bacterium]|nr:hypothetical protein [Thermoanaerobaculia bacterium]
MPPRVRRSLRAGAAALVVAAATVLGACEREEPDLSAPGSEQPAEPVPGGADPEAAAVIERWSATLSRGDVAGAARLFAIPSVAENGPTSIRIRDAADARLFNASLPCGARLTEAVQQGELVVATFELTERPGPGSCGGGTGGTARTAFAIENGRITEWRRVADEDPVTPGNPA